MFTSDQTNTAPMVAQCMPFPANCRRSRCESCPRLRARWNRIVDGNMPIKVRHSVGNKQRSLRVLFTYSLCLHVVNVLDQMTQIPTNQTKLHNQPTKHNLPLKQSWFKDHGNVLRSKQPTFRFVPSRYLAFWERSPMWLAEADIENERQVSKSASLAYVYLCFMCSNKC